ncbi:cyclase family protein [Streptomyces sp. L7]
MDDSWPRLDELPLERFAGRAVVARRTGAAGQGADHTRTAGACAEPTAPGFAAVARHRLVGALGHRPLPRPPVAHPEAAEALVAAGVRTVAVDALSVDPTPNPAVRRPTSDSPPTGCCAERAG